MSSLLGSVILVTLIFVNPVQQWPDSLLGLQARTRSENLTQRKKRWKSITTRPKRKMLRCYRNNLHLCFSLLKIWIRWTSTQSNHHWWSWNNHLQLQTLVSLRRKKNNCWENSKSSTVINQEPLKTAELVVLYSAFLRRIRESRSSRRRKGQWSAAQEQSQWPVGAQQENSREAPSLESLSSLKKEKQLTLENSVGSVLNASRRQQILTNINAKFDC